MMIKKLSEDNECKRLEIEAQKNKIRLQEDRINRLEELRAMEKSNNSQRISTIKKM